MTSSAEPAAPHAVLISFPGTNCDAETARALETTGFTTERIPLAVLAENDFAKADLIVFAGGFSYGDYVMAGRLAQLQMEKQVGGALREFVQGGGHALGICNGFQILTKMGVLPPGALIDNTHGRFMCRWVGLENRAPENPFLTHLPATLELPVAHAEGRFVIDPETAKRYLDDGLVTLTYAADVNGSTERIAGLADATGRVFGLMPHPERFLRREHHYNRDWSPSTAGERPAYPPEWGWGYHFFRGIADRLRETKSTGATPALAGHSAHSMEAG